MKYSPHEYQRYATEYIETHPVAADLFVKGVGKNSLSLTALNALFIKLLLIHQATKLSPPVGLRLPCRP